MTTGKSGSWIKWLVILLILGGIGAGAWYWLKERGKNSAVSYKTAAIGRGDLTQAVTANGQLSPVRSVTVGSQVSGIITDIKVDYNSAVTNQQVLAQIDPSTYKQNIVSAEADVANAKAALELADLNLARAENLRKADLISQSDYDKALVDQHQAKAVVQMREAALKRNQVDLERTTIYAPIDGVVISRSVDVGQTVAASFNTPTLFYIANDLRKMRIEAMVSEADVGGVQEGQRVTFTVDAFMGRQFEGRVTQVRYAPITNQNVVNYVCVIGVENSDMKLRPGMTATASIVTAMRTNALRLPNGALRFRPPETAASGGATNPPPAGAGSSGLATNAGTSNAPAVAGPTNAPPAGLGDFANMDREERRRRMESMSPEERERMRAMFRAARGDGQGGPGGFGGGSGRGRSEGSVSRTVYLVETNSAAGKAEVVIKPVTVKMGISDGAFTEVLDGLKEGDVVATGVNLPAGSTAAASTMRTGSSPFGGPPFGGFRPR